MHGTLKTVLGDIGRGAIVPCYLIYGDEEYLVADALDRIVDALLPPDQRDLNLFHMEGDNEDVDALCDSLLTVPLISGRKVVVARNTRLFHSRAVSSDVTEEIRSHLEDDPRRSVKAFLSLLETTGWSVEDLKDGQWKKISEDDWRSATGGPAAGRGEWLPTVLELCDRLEISGGGKRTDTGRLEEVLEGGIPAGNCLIVTAAAVDKRKRLFRVIADTGAVLSFSKAKSESGRRDLLTDRVEETLRERGKNITPDALRALGEKTGFGLRDSLQEIEKLVTYVGERETIDRSDIDAVVERTAEDSVFDLTNAIVERNAGTALQILGQLLDQGVNHILILTMIAREVRFLLQGHVLIESGKIPPLRPRMDYGGFQAGVYPAVKALAKPKGTWLANQHPYVIYNALRNSGRFSREELVGHIDRLAVLDRAVKSSGIDPALALKRLLIEMCRR
ncbi:MAG: DNA polymerase III subunit delta [Deltaproteobacteria bacterium]|nr:DNA polymerase III subunit delta [Deltaproteobacteria bacterium]